MVFRHQPDGGNHPEANRRPLRIRSARWTQALTTMMCRVGATPNGISIGGIVVSAGGAGAMLLSYFTPLWWLVAALSIQLRLIANLLDGMVAFESGMKTATGPLFNEMPDRIEDSMFLVAAGYGAGIPSLGWLAALLACGTAYVRVLGGSLGIPQDFCGPQAKQQRMAALTVAAVASAIWPAMIVMPIALSLISAGIVITLWRRTTRLAAHLKGVTT